MFRSIIKRAPKRKVLARPRLCYSARLFHTNAKFSGEIVYGKTVYQMVKNDIGMPVPVPTDTLYRTTNQNDVFNPFNIIFGFISRQSAKHHPMHELTGEHVRKHSLPGHKEHYFLGMSANRDESLKFEKYDNEHKILIHFDTTGSGMYIDVDKTLAAMTPDFSSDKLNHEVEFISNAMKFSAMKKIEYNGEIINSPFFLKIPNNLYYGNEKFYELYCYLIYYLAQLNVDPEKNKNAIQLLLQEFTNKKIEAYDTILGSKNNPFNLTVEQFSKKHSRFIDILSQCLSIDSHQPLEKQGGDFFKSRPNHILADLYRQSIYSYFLEHSYINNPIKNKPKL